MNLVARFSTLVNRQLPRASSTRSVGMLAGGTAAEQAIGVLVLPVTTRLHISENFSVWAVLASISGFVAKWRT
jgi:hypothetical protein